MAPLHHERRIVQELERFLRRTEPALAARFDFFTRLVKDEGPPPRELPGTE